MSGAPGGERPWAGRRIHLVGVGGAGMSAYARAAHALGAELSGSDAAEGEQTRALAAEGVLRAAIGHDAANIPAGEDVEVYHSSAIGPENAERSAARERGLAERPRADLLAELSALRRTIAVAGTHGKTTTASMLVAILRGAGMDPGWLVGAPVGGGLANANWSRGRVARDRGRRVGPLDAQPRGRDRRADERGARPPRDVLLARLAARGLPRAARGGEGVRGLGAPGAAGARRRGRRRL